MSLYGAVGNGLATALDTNQWGESITYTEVGEDPVTVTAIVQRMPTDTLNSDDGEVKVMTASVTVSSDDVADPAADDLFSFPEMVGGSAVDWVFIDRAAIGSHWRIEVSHAHRTTWSAPNRRADPAI